MPSRAQLELQARSVGVNPANYINDSVLEQRVIFQQKNATTVAGALATSTLTSTGVAPTAADTVTIGGRTYTFVAALGEAAATATIVSNGTNVSNGDTVQIGSQTYTYRTAISRPFDVNIGAAATNSLTNLANALSLGGTPGTDYGNGTTASGLVTGSVTTTTLTLTAKATGTNGNSIVIGTSAPTLTAGTFTGGTNGPAGNVLIGASAATALVNLGNAISGGTGAGTTYASSTPKNLDVSVGTVTATTVPVTATNASVNNTATTKSAVTLSWTGATLAGGSPSVLAPSTLASSVQAVSGGAQV